MKSLLGVLFLCSLAYGATNHWTCTKDDFWHTGSCWSGGVPKAEDDVVIDASGKYTITANQKVSIQKLTVGTSAGDQITVSFERQLSTTGLDVLAGANSIIKCGEETVSMKGTSVVSGTFTWHTGLISGSSDGSATLTVNDGAQVLVDSEDEHTFTGVTISVAGTLDWKSGQLTIGDSSHLSIGTGATFKAESNGQLTTDAGEHIQIKGAMSFGSGNPSIAAVIEIDGGSVSVKSGSINFQEGKIISSSGTFEVDSGATVTVGNVDTSNQNHFTIKGTVVVGTSTEGTTLGGTNQIEDLRIEGGVLECKSACPITTFNFNAGSFNHTGSSTIGTLDWVVGGISGVGKLPVSRQLTAREPKGKELVETNLIMKKGCSGSFSMGTIVIDKGAVLEFEDGSNVEFPGPGTITFDCLTDPHAKVTSAGSIKLIKPEAANVVQFRCPFTSSGSIEIDEKADIQALHSFTTSGLVTIKNGGSMECRGGSTDAAFTFETTAALTGGGTFEAGAGVTTFKSGVDIGYLKIVGAVELRADSSISTLELTGGSDFTGTANVIANVLTLKSGHIGITGSIATKTMSHDSGINMQMDKTTIIITESAELHESVFVLSGGAHFVIDEGAVATVYKHMYLNLVDSAPSTMTIDGTLQFAEMINETTTVGLDVVIGPAGNLIVNEGRVVLRGQLDCTGNITVGNTATSFVEDPLIPGELQVNQEMSMDVAGQLVGDGIFHVACVGSPCGALLACKVEIGTMTIDGSGTTFSYPFNSIDHFQVLNGGPGGKAVTVYAQIVSKTFIWKSGDIEGWPVLQSKIVVHDHATVQDTNSKNLNGVTLIVWGDVDWIEGPIIAGRGCTVQFNRSTSIKSGVRMSYGNGAVPDFINNGDITVETDSAIEFQVNVLNNGRINMGSGDISIKGDYVQDAGDASFRLGGGKAETLESGWLFNGGVVSGSGTLSGNVGMSARLSVTPGETLIIDGEYVHGRDGILDIGVGGLNAGEFGTVEITSDMLIYGKAVITLVGGYSPTGETTTLHGSVKYNSLSQETVFVDAAVEEGGVKNEGFTVEPTYNAQTIDFALTSEPASITGTEPNIAPMEGGTRVSITGFDLNKPEANLEVRVEKDGETKTIGGSLDGDRSIVIEAPKQSTAGVATITVLFDNVVIPSPVELTYYEEPTITSVSPEYVLPGGTANVTIKGHGFLDSNVMMAGFTPQGKGAIYMPATRVSDEMVYSVSPPLEDGFGDMLVGIAIDGQTLKNSATTLTIANVTLEHLSVNSAPLSIGNSGNGLIVTLTGTGFPKEGGTMFVGFTNAAKGISVSAAAAVVSSTQLTFSPPNVEYSEAVSTGVSLSFDNAAFTGELAQFEFLPTPVVDSITPLAGKLNVESTVVIFGSGFIPGTILIRFALGAGAVDVPGTYVSPSVVSCHTPSSAVGEAVTVTVSVDGGDTFTKSSAEFTFAADPSAIISSTTGESVPEKGGLGGGAVAGISIATAVVGVAIGAGIMFAVSKGKTASGERQPLMSVNGGA